MPRSAAYGRERNEELDQLQRNWRFSLLGPSKMHNDLEVIVSHERLFLPISRADLEE